MKRIIVFAIVACLCLAIIEPAQALRASVYFEGGAENFVFYPGSEWSDTDLFSELKDALPGDTLDEEFKIRNAAPEYDYIKLYLRADMHNDENLLSEEVAETETVTSMQDFLTQLELKVWNGDELIYDAAPSELAGLTSNTYLGSYRNGDAATIRVELLVPSSLGNEYMHRAGEVDWIFVAEAYLGGEIVEPTPSDNPEKQDDDEPTPNNAKTIDEILHYVSIFILSLSCLIFLVMLIRRCIVKKA